MGSQETSTYTCPLSSSVNYGYQHMTVLNHMWHSSAALLMATRQINGNGQILTPHHKIRILDTTAKNRHSWLHPQNNHHTKFFLIHSQGFLSTHTYTLRFNGHFSRWTWVSRLPLNSLLFLDCASFWDGPKLSMSFLTQSHQVFLRISKLMGEI